MWSAYSLCSRFLVCMAVYNFRHEYQSVHNADVVMNKVQAPYCRHSVHTQATTTCKRQKVSPDYN